MGWPAAEPLGEGSGLAEADWGDGDAESGDGDAESGEGDAESGDGDAESGDGELDWGGGDPEPLVGTGGGGLCGGDCWKIRIAISTAKAMSSIMSNHDTRMLSHPERS